MAFNDEIRRLVAQMKEEIDLHDLAEWLGMVRPKQSGNYRSPNRADKAPSVSIFNSGRAWKDHASGEAGSCVDLVIYCRGCDQWEAIKTLFSYRGIAMPRPEETERRERSKEEWIADQCLKQAEMAIPYLRDVRKIPEATIKAAIDAKTVGFNSWASDRVAAGEVGHGGAAAAFIVRSLNPGQVMAVDMRYLDPAASGLKTQTQGPKQGHPWLPYQARKLKSARTVYVVESPINALSIEACEFPATMAIATRGLLVEEIDWNFLRGKQVVICFDADQTNEQGKRPGPEAGWRLYDLLTAQNIASVFVDQSKWAEDEFNDVNDILQAGGVDELKTRLRLLDDAVIPGLPKAVQDGPKRLWLPGYDFAVYWKFRAQADYSDFMEEAGSDDPDDKRVAKYIPMAGFRVAGISRVTIQSHQATFAGAEDLAPDQMFAVTVQTPRHKAELQRAVYKDNELHKLTRWQEFGPVHNPQKFLRMLSILERTVDFGARKAANFVGVCWRDRRLVVNEGLDCYFIDAEYQCAYSSLRFHRGRQDDAATVVKAFASSFTNSAGVLPLAWILGGVALKCALSFWPHFEIQGPKGVGKSKLAEWLGNATGMKVLSAETVKSDYRVLSSVGYSSMPVCWEEISTAGRDAIKRAISMLQQCYTFAPSLRSHKQMLSCCPVMLAGEEVESENITGKLVRSTLKEDRKRTPIPHNLPPFPMRAWLDWVTRLDVGELRARHDRLRELCRTQCRASARDGGGKRMVENYAALLLGWKLIAEFAGLEDLSDQVQTDLIAEMNGHIADTVNDREPYVWILEKLSSEIANKRFMHPYAWEEVLDKASGVTELCLVVKPAHVMDHMSGSMQLRDWFNGLPVKTARVFKRQCLDSGLVVDPDVAETIQGVRHFHCLALSVARMEAKGIGMPVPVEKLSGTPAGPFAPPQRRFEIYDERPD